MNVCEDQRSHLTASTSKTKQGLSGAAQRDLRKPQRKDFFRNCWFMKTFEHGRKGWTVFLLVCCAVLVTSRESNLKITDCARQMMNQCKQDGYEMPKMDSLASMLGSDVILTGGSDSTSLLSTIGSVMGTVSSGYIPSTISNFFGKAMSDACFMNAVTAPMAWDKVCNMEADDMSLEDYKTLLSSAKTALMEECARKINLPQTIQESRMGSLSEEQKAEVANWFKEKFKETYFNCSSRPTSSSVKCDKSLQWLTGQAFTMLGSYLSELSSDDIDLAPQEGLCGFFKSPKFKEVIVKIGNMKPSLARQLLNKIRRCFDKEAEFLNYLDRLGPLACFYEPPSQLTANSSALLSAYSNCTNPEVKMCFRKHQKDNAFETICKLGSEVKQLQNSMDQAFSYLNETELKKLINGKYLKVLLSFLTKMFSEKVPHTIRMPKYQIYSLLFLAKKFTAVRSNLGSLCQGITCESIESVSNSKAEEMSQRLADWSQQLNKAQARCAALKLFAALESKRTDYFKTITQEELGNISSIFLIQLPPEKVNELPDSVCSVFLDKMQMANLSSLSDHAPSRPALVEKALMCLGTDLSSFTSEDISKLGPLLCEVLPSKLRLLSSDVLRTSLQAMESCDYIPPTNREELVQLISETFGNPSSWSPTTLEQLGSLLCLFESNTYSLPMTSGMKEAVSYLIQRDHNVCESLEKARFDLTLASPVVTTARRKRAASANANSNANSKPTSSSSSNTTTNTTSTNTDLSNETPTVERITELGLLNVYWTPEQLSSMNQSVFEQTVKILGSVTGYSPAQLDVLKSKATKAFGAADKMNNTEVVLLGCIAQGFSNAELMNMSFALDSLTDIANCGWNSSQIRAVWKAVEDYNKLSPQTLEASDMVTLSRFMCGLSADEIRQLNTTAFMEAVVSMNGLKCSMEVQQQYKNLTIAAYGNPHTWTAAEVAELGTFVAGLDASEFASLNISVFQHISKSCIPLIPPENFAALSLEKITALGPDNAALVTDSQKAPCRRNSWQLSPRPSKEPATRSLRPAQRPR
ncbi:hypothetical protein WMY93_026429 [Mugilogobius chulae]|uniref:Otoancorin n=1 Tax=Mugilogobius chulae TaxID=88201 RepID=A0AAW0N1Y3_9GOBI